MRRHINDGTTDAPKLRVFLNLDTLLDLPPDSLWPGLQGAEMIERLRSDGFEGVQASGTSRLAGFPHCGLGRVNEPAEALPIRVNATILMDSSASVSLVEIRENRKLLRRFSWS